MEISLVDLNCDCCGRKDERLLLQKAGALTKAMFNVVQCNGCGFVYINPRPSEISIKNLYDEAYYNGKGFDSYVDYVGDYCKASDDDKVFRPQRFAMRFLKHRKPPARLLDYGCGLGDLMRQAEALGYYVDGFEIFEFGRSFAFEHGGNVFGKSDEIPENSYDLVSAIEVLEHCFRPSEAFSTIYRILNPGGIFVYTTEDIDIFLLTRQFGLAKDHPYIAPEGHVNFFGRRTASRFLRRAGFSALGKPYTVVKDGLFSHAKFAVKRVLRLDLPSAIK